MDNEKKHLSLDEDLLDLDDLDLEEDEGDLTEDETSDELIEQYFSDIFKTEDVSDYMEIIRLHYPSLLLYIIEPYVSESAIDTSKIPVTENYTIHDFGGKLIVTVNDIFTAPSFSSSEFFIALEELIQLVIKAGATEIALLGDHRGKKFIWDYCDKLKTMENIPINIVNYDPSSGFLATKEAVLNYLHQHGMEPKPWFKKQLTIK